MAERPGHGNASLILLCGPIAAPGKPAGGGFQSGNRRVSDILRRQGHEVEELPYPEGIPMPIGKAAAYALSFARIGWRLLTLARRRPAAVHFTPLAQQFLLAETACCLIAKLRGVPIILDLRAGTHLTDYRDKSEFYRFVYRILLRQARIVSYEGEVYETLVSRIVPATPSWYLPNFIEAGTLPAAVPERPPQLELIYVGRVSLAKGALHAARCLQRLQQSDPDAGLTLVGGVDDDCRRAIAALEIANIRFTGPLPPEQVRALLDRSHYFMFLTHWWGEGHSNALTEAMARGCVPVFTLHGFNEAIAGSVGIRVSDRDDTTRIATDILAIWEASRWRQMAERASARVRAHYSSEQAEHTLRAIYSGLWN